MECVNYICTSVGLIFLLRMALYILQDTHSTRLSRNLAIWYDMATQAESYMYQHQYDRGNMSLIIPFFPCYDFETIIPTSWFIHTIIHPFSCSISWYEELEVCIRVKALKFCSSHHICWIFFILVSLTRIFAVVVHKAPLEIS
jgi:hypothetical protein